VSRGPDTNEFPNIRVLADGRRLTLVACPACGANLDGEYVPRHIKRHDPEDFGLSPIGKRKPGTQLAADGGDGR
jgi:hypothetical protein